MKTMSAVEVKKAFGQLLEATIREPVAVRKSGGEVGAMFSMEDIRALADSFLADRLKSDVAAGRLDILDAIMAQIEVNRRLEAGRQAISEGDGSVADVICFASLRDRGLRRVP